MATHPGALASPLANRLSKAAKASAFGLVLTAVGMLLQIAAGSTLYPSLAGPIVLFAAAAIVVLKTSRWTPYLALVVPLVLGLGAMIAALMSGAFVEQLTGIDRPGLLLGSLAHGVGLVVAVAGGVGMVLGSRATAANEH